MKPRGTVPSAPPAEEQSAPARTLGLRLLDGLEGVRATLFPRGAGGLTPWLFLLPALLLTFLLVAGIVPLLDTSLRQLDRATFRPGEDWTLANFHTLWERPVYTWLAARTMGAALVVTVLSLLLALPYAWLMVRTPRPWLKKLLLVSLFLPFFIGQVVRAYGWLIILGKEGLINTGLKALGLPALDLIYNYPSVVFGLIQYMLPFAVLLIVPALAAIGEEVEMASESLGASWIATFRHVLLPMAKPGLIGAGVVVFTLTMTDFAMPEILGGGTTDFIASAIYDSFFQISNPGLGSALSIILVVLGSVLVGVVFYAAGTGTLGIRGAAK